jgi:cell volume regulation protein A
VGAIVSSTDASAVFGILGGMNLPKKVSNTIELESGLNDPVAVILTLAMTGAIVGVELPLTTLVFQMLYQLVLGAVFGLALGYAGRLVLTQIPPSTPALYPVLTLGFALMAFGAPAVLDASGFLAVYIAGIIIGNSKVPERDQILRVHESLSWLSQVSMFLLLGLLVNPHDLPKVAVSGTLIALAVAFIARPIAVTLCLLPFRYTVRERLFISWVGLRGAVPIIMATVPILRAEIQTGQMVGLLDVFDLVFFIVIISSFIPGATVSFVARSLGLDRSEAESAICAPELTVTTLHPAGT